MIDSLSSTLPRNTEAATSSMLTQLVRPLVDYPEHCSVHVRSLGDAATFTVLVAPQDLEKFSGSNARTGRSLQIILSAVGSKTRRRFSLSFQAKAAVSEAGACLTG